VGVIPQVREEIRGMSDEILEQLAEETEEIFMLPYENTGDQQLFPAGNLSQ
jgi:hypothetical protein